LGKVNEVVGEGEEERGRVGKREKEKGRVLSVGGKEEERMVAEW
jgi:hypothetical protein